jgi:endonuclease YncB( thermonuclease family)
LRCQQAPQLLIDIRRFHLASGFEGAAFTDLTPGSAILFIMTSRQLCGPTAIPWVVLAAYLLLVQAALAEDLRGRVVGITDGDTLTLLTDRREQIRVRLAEIDTPERGQPYGNRARQTLSGLAFGKTVRIVVRDTDRYGRTVGRVFAGSQDINAEMVRRGAAWVYRRYSDDPNLLRLEQAARAEKRGLWGLPEAQRVPPWEWRAAKRQRR